MMQARKPQALILAVLEEAEDNLLLGLCHGWKQRELTPCILPANV
jgi:hypothetical protein